MVPGVPEGAASGTVPAVCVTTNTRRCTYDAGARYHGHGGRERGEVWAAAPAADQEDAPATDKEPRDPIMGPQLLGRIIGTLQITKAQQRGSKVIAKGHPQGVR